MTTLLAIDGTNLLYRTYHAQVDTPRAQGEHWVVGGFVETVSRLLLLHRPTSVVVALDGDGGCPFRKVLVPTYKAGRAETPDVLREALREAGEVLSALCVPWREETEWEADDVLATLATRADERGAKAVVVTSDKDAHQLVGGTISVYKPEGTFVSDEYLVTKYGVTGSRWIEFAALVGEKSDNLPGATGIGPKRAALVIAACGDVEELLLDPQLAQSRLGDRLAGMLREGGETFLLNRKVATLRRDLEVSLSELHVGRMDPELIRSGAASLGIDRVGRNLAAAVSQVRTVQALV
jgi:DNA polymerase I